MTEQTKSNLLVSVVMGVYNAEPYLREAVDSVLAQSLPDFEFVIVNDGSTDRSREILESYRDERIVLVHQENMGLTKSLNKGIALAKGKYIARQDADDRSYPERLATQSAFLASHPEIALVGSAVEVLSNGGKSLAIFRHPCESAEIKEALKKFSCFWHGSVMFKRDSFLALGGYDENFATAQDYDLWLRFNERYQLANLREPLYAYRFATNCITIRKMVSQHRLAGFARNRAAARAEGITQEPTPERVAMLLSAPLTTEERRQIITNYKPWCRLLLKNELFDDARQLMVELFRYHPSLFFRLSFCIGRHLNERSYLSRFLENA